MVTFKRHLAWQGMGGTAKTGIIGPEGHLDHIQHGFGDLHVPFLIKFWAAFLIDMAMDAILLVVPTIRFTLVRIPRSSVQ